MISICKSGFALGRIAMKMTPRFFDVDEKGVIRVMICDLCWCEIENKVFFISGLTICEKCHKNSA